MKNYKITVQYSGTNYSGWQIQQNAKSVQGLLSNAINTVLRDNISLIGAGRTDAGVHASGQCANFRTEKNIIEREFVYSVNSILPKDIAIHNLTEVGIDFHSRYDAKRRIYYYLISKRKSPFYFDYSLYRLQKISINQVNMISKFFLGTYNFTSFAKTADQSDNKVCTIYDARWRETDLLYYFRIEADRYLHSMVRTIVGTILNFHDFKIQPEKIHHIIQQEDRTAAAESVAAKGLFLYKIIY